jgi:putative ABC transport system permease protein
MSLGDSLQVAIEALIANKLRAALTMLGIVIGVGAVIALMAVGQGSQAAVTERIQGLGSNLIFVRPGSANQGAGVRGGIGTAQTLTTADAEAIRAASGVVAVAPEVRVPLQLSAAGQNTATRVLGVTPEYASVRGLSLAEGEFFSDSDMDSRRRVLVLGKGVADRLFGDNSPIGQTVRAGIGRLVVNLTVIGVLEGKGGTAQESQDDLALVPLSTVQNQISAFVARGNATAVAQITVQVRDKNDVGRAKLAIDAILREQHNVAEPDYIIESQEDIQSAINEVSDTMTILLGSIAGISLVVGGIGIMNIMLVSVTERTREIGIRKAVGARKNDIMMQFLTEALTVTVAGGLLGIGAGLGVAEFLNGRSIAGLGENVRTVVSWTSVVVAFGVSAGIGLFFGLYPAQRASNLSPIEALRYE